MPTLTEDCVESLAEIVGPASVQHAGQSLSVAPATHLEIAEVLRFANARRLSVTPTGAGTKLPWGNPVSPAILLSLARLKTLRDHAWQDMTCTVDAGCTWTAMQQALSRHGQMVALDPLWPATATVGGIVATNDSGPLRLKYGSLRDHIIGMTVILADGTIAKTGGKVVKNVAGYDLHKLLCGSFGTLGIVAEINFRLHPIEQHARTWSMTSPTASALEAPLLTLLDSHMPISCLQLRSDAAAFTLDVRIASLPDTVAALAPRIDAIAAGLPLEETGDAVWQTRQRLFDQPDRLLVKASMLPADIPSMTAQLHLWAHEARVEVATVTQGPGLMTIALSATPPAVPVIERLRTALQATNGSAVILHAPPSLPPSLDRWGSPSDSLPLMRELKRRFDPAATLNPGRFVGGI